jgi:nitrite reductase (NADH) small subunit
MTVLDEQTTSVADPAWVEVCRVGDVVPDRGVCALIGSRAVAVFRCSSESSDAPDQWFAVDNQDPFTGTSVLSRGIVGSVGARLVVVSPLLKQRFDLATGDCIDDVTVTLDVWPVRVTAGRVQVGAKGSSAGNHREIDSKHGPATIGP